MIKKKIIGCENESSICSEKTKGRKFWTTEEDITLKASIKLHGSNWKVIAEYLDGRNPSQCAQRWKRIKPNKGKIRQRWSKREDQKLKQLIKEHDQNWTLIAQLMPHRTGRQIRERYMNHLDPNIDLRPWTPQEDLQIWEMFNKIGTKWTEMAKQMIGRPENMIKNRYYGYIRTVYNKQPNPYYLIPQKKRNIQMESIIHDQQSVSEISSQSFDYREQGLDYSEFYSVNPFSSDRHILSNLAHLQKFSRFKQGAIDKEQKMIEMFQSNCSNESFPNLSHYNQIFQNNSYYKQKEDDDCFFNQSEVCLPLKIRQDIFEELTKSTIEAEKKNEHSQP